MKMRNRDKIQITRFLCMVSPIVAEIVRTILRSFDWQVSEEGKGLDLAFSIKSGEKQIKFYLHNLLMEIATIDRDQQPPRFDENLRDFDFFLTKTTQLTQSKLNILFYLLKEQDLDTTIEDIIQATKHYERIRIWKIDQNKSSPNPGN